MAPKKNQPRRKVQSTTGPDGINILPQKIAVPSEPPGVKPSCAIRKVYRYTTTDESAPITVTGTWLDTNLGMPSNRKSMYIHSIKVWCPASSTADGYIQLVDSGSGMVWRDTSTLGRPPATLGIRFGEKVRVDAILPTSTTAICVITTAGGEATIDVSMMYIEA